jgi:hypothetical protein
VLSKRAATVHWMIPAQRMYHCLSFGQVGGRKSSPVSPEPSKTVSKTFRESGWSSFQYEITYDDDRIRALKRRQSVCWVIPAERMYHCLSSGLIGERGTANFRITENVPNDRLHCCWSEATSMPQVHLTQACSSLLRQAIMPTYLTN